MHLFGKKTSNTPSGPITRFQGNSPADARTEKNGPQAETPATPRATLNTAAPVARRPLRTWVIEHMPAFIRRREAKKHAPQAAELQMSKILQAFKDVNPGAAKPAALDLKAALMPLLSKKPNAPNHEQLMAEFMGKHIPTDRKGLEKLSHDLEVLQNKDEVLELLSFVVKANLLDVKAAFFRNQSLEEIERVFFDQDGATAVKNLSATQLKELSGMKELAESVAKDPKNLSRDDKIPGTRLTISTAQFMASCAATARPWVEQRNKLLALELDELNMKGLVTLQNSIAKFIADKPEKAPRDNEMHDRYDAVLEATLKLQEEEEQAERKGALMEQESMATSTDALNKLLSDTDKWFTNAPKNAPRDPELEAMYKRALKNRELAHVRAEKLTALLSVNVDDLDSLEGLNAFKNQLGTLSKLVPMDKAQQAEMSAQQMKTQDRIMALEDEINKKKRTQ